MANKVNPNSVFFLVEGHTEVAFYNKIFAQKVPPRKIRIAIKNLEGNGGINKKIQKQIQALLDDAKHQKEQHIYVFVAIDREGTRDEVPETPTDISGLKKLFIKSKKSRIKDIVEIIATQDLESWFFHDIDGIYEYLKTPKSERKPYKYADVEQNTNNKVLAALFKKYGKIYYKKGSKASELIEALDLEKIYHLSADLSSGIQKIIDLTD